MAKRQWNEWTAEEIAVLFDQYGIKPQETTVLARNKDGVLCGCAIGVIAVYEGAKRLTSKHDPDDKDSDTIVDRLEQRGYSADWLRGLWQGFDGLDCATDLVSKSFSQQAGYAIGVEVRELVKPESAFPW